MTTEVAKSQNHFLAVFYSKTLEKAYLVMFLTDEINDTPRMLRFSSGDRVYSDMRLWNLYSSICSSYDVSKESLLFVEVNVWCLFFYLLCG